MFGFKTKIKVSEMSIVLYNFTVNPEYLNNTVESLSKDKALNKDTIRLEVIILIVIIVDYLLHSKKVRKSLGENADDLFISYLGHFKEETEKLGMDSIFTVLLNERGHTYNAILENHNPKTYLNPTFEIAEIFSKNCDAENQPIFIMKALNIFSSNLKILEKLLNKFKLTQG